MRAGIPPARALALLVKAALLLAPLLVCHALGLRDHVSVLSGTAPPGGGASVPLGILYALAWFIGVVVAPVVALAALLLAAAGRLLGGAGTRRPAGRSATARPAERG